MKILITGCARSGTTLLLYVMKYFKNTQVITHEEIMPTRITFADKKSRNYIKREYGKILVIKKPMVHSRARRYESIKDILAAGFKIIYIIRDGRDIMVSHHPKRDRRYHVNPVRWIETSAEILEYLDNPRVLLIEYEDFVSDTEKAMELISKFLRVEYSQNYKNFHEDKEIAEGIDIKGHMATGLGDKGARPISKDSTGNWKLKEHKDRISSLVNGPKEDFERFCDLLIKFGYEKDNSWADAFKR